VSTLDAAHSIPHHRGNTSDSGLPIMRKPLSGLGFLLGIAGFAIFVAVIVETWKFKRQADQELTAAMEKANQAGDVAERVIALVRQVIARANDSLVTTRAESAKTTPGGNEDPLVRMAMWKARRSLPNEVERARDAVGIASEVVVVANAALDVFGEHPKDG